MKKEKLPQVVLVGLGIIVLILVLIFLISRPEEKKVTSLYGVKNNYTVKDKMIMELYQRFQLEDGILYSLMGTDLLEDYYAYYYQHPYTSYTDLSSIVKNYIVLKNSDYQKETYYEDGRYYEISLEIIREIYEKIFGTLNDFELKSNDVILPKFEVVGDKVRIYAEEGLKDYNSTIDTFFVNGVRQGENIIIYERVAFIKLTDKYYEFYSDYQRKELVYRLNREKADGSFLNRSDIVSSVLVEYQDEFPLVTFTYEKGVDSYYFKNVEL